MEKNKIYTGLLSLHSHGEADDILFLSSLSEPLADELDWIEGKEVTVKYSISDKECSREEVKEEFLHNLFGKAYAEYGHVYTEYTGYLYTDEDLNIGGHNLLEEFKSNIGKWIILDITVNN